MSSNNLRKICLIFFISILTFVAFAKVERKLNVLCNLENKWFISDQNNNVLTPYVKDKSFSNNDIHFKIDVDRYRANYLLLYIPAYTTLFFDQEIYAYYKKDTTVVLPIKKIVRDLQKEKGEIWATLYSRNLEPDNVKTKIVNYIPAKEKWQEAKDNLPLVRKTSWFVNFISISFIIIFIFFVVLLNVFPETTSQLLNVSSVFSIKIEETQVNKSTLNLGQLFYLVLLSAVLGHIFFQILFYTNSEALKVENLTNSIGIWLLFTVIVGLFIALKYISIKIVGWIFGTENNDFSHFTEYVRISLLFYMLLFFLLTLLMVNLPHYNKSIFISFIAFVLIFLIFRVILLFFKLFNNSSFRIFYLFSYLCIAEIIPLIIGVKIILKEDFF